MANTNITPSLGTATLTGAAPVGQVDDPTLTSLGSVAFTGAAPTPRVAHSGLSITNPNATTNVPVNYQIDDRTGFKVKVKDPMVEEYTGFLVRPDSLDVKSEQEFVRSKRNESQRGPMRPEPVGDERFVETEYPNGVSADDF